MTGEKKAGASIEAPAFFEGGAPSPGPQALLQAHFGGLGAFCKRKGPYGRARRARRSSPAGKIEEAEGRFPGGKPPHGKRPFFSCKKGPKNTPEGWAFRACGRGKDGLLKKPPLTPKTFAIEESEY